MNKGSGTLRGSLAALAGRGARWNLAEMATESVMVVFAVLIAFGVEEWREERQLRQFAAVARAAVELEIEENLDEFTATEEALRSLTVLVGEVIRADNESDAVFDEFEFPPMRLPDTSSAAWSAAQASEAAPYFDYGWIIRVAQAYDILDAYERLRDQFLDSMSFVAVKISSGMHPPRGRGRALPALRSTVPGWERTRGSETEDGRAAGRGRSVSGTRVGTVGGRSGACPDEFVVADSGG